MRNVLLASLAALSAVVANSGCILGCGGYEGAGNRAYERSSEMLLLCENGGFVASLETTMLEGRYVSKSTDLVAGNVGEDGSLAFELHDNADGTAYAPQLGDGAWTEVDLDFVAKDHANVLCSDLTVRAWWKSAKRRATFDRRAIEERSK